ncbi:MAG: response regulator transcription factor [Lachnospiraceae bacterium]|jgi:DNA-binding response OmpR family regulator|nr:response regulator transcription factor [Lachnospiraceae bacterium]MBR7000135.1 response regulator transcription factor [Lachnospiraceae bacterium]MCR5530648.1 response regulator transcription factor [Lachnospiraceae bacterium]
MAVRVLIVEDEEQIARFTELELRHEGYEVAKAMDGRTGLSMAEEGNYDIILLDIMLPELNGLEVLRRLRKTSDVPVILLTARDAVMDKVSGLDSGADDYVTKPFAIEELLARIRVALKKKAAAKPAEDESAITYGKLKVNVSAYSVTYDGTPIELSKREFDLLTILLQNRNIVLSRDTLLGKVCGYDYFGETNVIDVYVRHVRSKIDEPYGINLIQTVRGVGYVIKDE